MGRKGRSSASWILGLSAVLWVATAGCSKDLIDCKDSSATISNIWGGDALTTSGNCAATCERWQTDAAGAPDLGCVYVYVRAVAEGPCTIRIDNSLYAPIEAHVLVYRVTGDPPCAGLYVTGGSFEFTDAGTTDAAVE